MVILSNDTHQRTIGAFSIWAIGVGLVISGESFGWNLGWAIMGPLGFMYPVLLVTIMYYSLVVCNIELACTYPDAEGPHTYVANAFGHGWGKFIAVATLVEFLFATPAIADALGEYLNFLAPELINKKLVAIAFVLFFCIVNLFKINISILVTIIITFFAITELLIYFYSISQGNNFHSSNLIYSGYDKYDFGSFIQSIPFAIWLFLGIEGINLVSKDIKAQTFRKSISKGYKSSFWTLFALIVIILVVASASVTWSATSWAAMVGENNSHPLPFSMSLVLSRSNPMVQIFTFIGVFGLIASLQGIGLASINQLQSLLKQSLLNKLASRLLIGSGIPNSWLAALVVFIISLLTILLQETQILIELSVFGAVCMYLFTCLSLLKLRQNERNGVDNYILQPKNTAINYLHKDFKSWQSTLCALVVIILSLLCMLSLVLGHIYYFIAFIVLSLAYVFYDPRK